MKFSVRLPLRRWRQVIGAHRLASGVAALALASVGYFGYRTLAGTNGEIRYVFARTERGTLVVSVNGSGQVTASNQIDLKPKASGEVTSVAVQNGQEVRASQLIVQLDARDAARVVRDAQTSLASARLALEKLQQPADALSLLQANNALSEATNAKQNAGDDLIKAYDDAFTDVADAFLDLPAIMTGLHDMFYTGTLSASSNQWNIDTYMNAVLPYDERVRAYHDDVNTKYQAARTAYDKNFQDYKSASRSSDLATVESLLAETSDTAKAAAEAVKSGTNLIQFYEDRLTEKSLKPAALADTHLATLTTYTGKMNTHLADLLSVRSALQTDRDAIGSADRTIAEKTGSLTKLKAGADPLDVQTQELAVQQRENALRDAQEALANYSVRAPFDGVIAKINTKRSDSVSSGTAVATLITKQKIAEVSLNEVDVAKVKTGEKSTLTFDAITGLAITGAVLEIDAVGTVTQGVVTYAVKIGFDTQDERVKPGMSVSAAIVTDVLEDAVLVPNAAVKSQGDRRYVELLDGLAPDQQPDAAGVTSRTPPRRQPVDTGAANDSQTAITNGLDAGTTVVVRTINPNALTTQPQQTSGLRLFGAPGGGARSR